MRVCVCVWEIEREGGYFKIETYKCNENYRVIKVHIPCMTGLRIVGMIVFKKVMTAFKMVVAL